MKNMIFIRSALVLLFLMLFSNLLHARNIEIGQWVPWKILDPYFKDLNLDIKNPINSLQIEADGVLAEVSESQIHIWGPLNILNFTDAGIELGSVELNAQIQIGSIKIEKTIVKIVAGNTIKIRINAKCNPFAVDFKSINVNSYWGLLSDLNISLQDLQLGYELSHMSQISCTGTGGIDRLLEEAIKQKLNQKTELITLALQSLKPMLESHMVNKWKLFTADITKVNELNSFARLQINKVINSNQKGILLGGDLNLVDAKGNDVKLNQSPVSEFSETSPQLLISDDGFRALLEEGIRKLSPPKIVLNEIPDFKKLLKSRLKQFFIWPDLLKFSKKAQFILQTNSLDVIEINSVESKWVFQSPISGKIFAERNKNLIEYLDWQMNLNGEVTPEIKDSQLYLNVNTINAKIFAKYDDDYKKDFNPKKKISKKLFQKIQQTIFGEKTLVYPLPDLKIHNELWFLSNMKKEYGAYLIDWNKLIKP